MTSKDDEFDAAAWVARLQQSRLEHARVVERRPEAQEVSSSLRALGTHLYKWTDVSREVACAAAGLDPRATYEWVPDPESVAAADAGALSEPIAAFCDSESRLSMHWLPTNPTRNPTDWGIEFLSRCIRTATECITAMGTLLEAGEHLRAPLILARSCIEAMATACYLIDASVDQRERTRRVLNLHLAQIKESQLESLSLQSGDDQDEETELRELMAFAEHLGYSLGNYRADKWKPPVILGAGQAKDPTGAVIDQVLPGIGRSIWRSLSAVAHSRGAQTLMPDEHTLAHELAQWQRTEVVARHALPAILVLRELCSRLSAFLGWPFDELDELLEVIGTQLAIATGLADAAIRRDLGLPPVG